MTEASKKRYGIQKATGWWEVRHGVFEYIREWRPEMKRVGGDGQTVISARRFFESVVEVLLCGINWGGTTWCFICRRPCFLGKGFFCSSNKLRNTALLLKAARRRQQLRHRLAFCGAPCLTCFLNELIKCCVILRCSSKAARRRC